MDEESKRFWKRKRSCRAQRGRTGEVKTETRNYGKSWHLVQRTGNQASGNHARQQQEPTRSTQRHGRLRRRTQSGSSIGKDDQRTGHQSMEPGNGRNQECESDSQTRKENDGLENCGSPRVLQFLCNCHWTPAIQRH